METSVGIKNYLLITKTNKPQILTDEVIDKNLMIKTLLKTLRTFMGK